MTIEQFLARLRETPREWVLEDRWLIRLGECCPITALAAGMPPAKDWSKAGRTYGLVGQDAYNIMAAADATFDAARVDIQSALRVRLLEACGLTEGA